MDLREKLKKIEALFEGAKTKGEKQAAENAKKRILKRFEKQLSSNPVEYRVSLRDEWRKRLFVSICNKYGIKTYRYSRQKYTTTMVRVPQSFMKEILWPEFKKYASSLKEFLSSITNDLIEKIHKVEEDTIISGEMLPVSGIELS